MKLYWVLLSFWITLKYYDANKEIIFLKNLLKKLKKKKTRRLDDVYECFPFSNFLYNWSGDQPEVG